jgi:hypothetical protein
VIRHLGKHAIELLTISALVVVSRGLAQEHNGSRDGLYNVPDSDGSSSVVRESTTKRSRDSYLKSLDPRGEQYAQGIEEGKAKATAIATEQDPLPQENWSPWPGIVAGVGLLLLLAACGYGWWTRARSSRALGPALLAAKRSPTQKPDRADKHGTPPNLRGT